MTKSSGTLRWIYWCELGSILITVLLILLVIFSLITGSILLPTLSIIILILWHIGLALIFRNLNSSDIDTEATVRIRWRVWKRR